MAFFLEETARIYIPSQRTLWLAVIGYAIR
jgi:hypothetical protein